MSLSKLLLSVGKKALTKQAKTPTTGAVATRPMEMGSVTPATAKPIFGSTTFDRIAQKGSGEFTADEWADWLTDRGKRSLNLFGQKFEEGFIRGKRFKLDQKFSKGSRLFNKEQTVPIEELFDSNIAQFDRAGNLSGGLLFQAKLANVKVPGSVLGDMVKLNPAYRLSVKELGVPQSLINSSEKTLKETGYRLESISRGIDRSFIKSYNEGIDAISEIELEKLAREMSGNINVAQQELKKISKAIKKGDRPRLIENALENFTTSLKEIKKNSNPQQKIILNKLQGEIDDIAAAFQNVKVTKYANESNYTVPGGKNYRESILNLDENIPLNRIGKMENPHYDGKEFKANPIVHVRYDTRVTPDGKKAFLIHEIQSDSNQGISKYLRDRGAEPFNTPLRTNPYQNDVIIEFLTKARNKIANDILQKKIPSNQIELQINNLKKLDNQLKSITRKSIMERVRAGGAVSGSPERVDYFPLLDRSSQARAALSFLTNKAAKEGVDFISIAPSTSLQRGMTSENYGSYLEFYGLKNGNKIEGGKSLAVIPDLMKKIAKEFDTQAGPIKLNKSDKTKPFKKVETYNVNVGPKTYKNIHHIDEFSNQQPGTVEIRDDSLKLYDDYFSVRVSPNMVEPQKLYKSQGGFIEKANYGS